MMITEHNYEECFLLYIDNELAAVERKAVEEFIAAHPQYAAILSALQETKLSADSSISFLNKEALYKDEATDIGVSNYEEYFLLYTDNELTNEQKETTERFVLQHPQLQEEFTLLQQTKLTSEIIEYKNKEELYKKERRTIPLYIAGLSVAAAVFAVMLFAGLFSSEHQPLNPIASASVKKHASVVKPSEKDNSAAGVANGQDKQLQENTFADKSIKQRTEESNHLVAHQESRLAEHTQESLSSKQPAEEVTLAHIEESQAHTVQSTLPDNNTTAKPVSTLKPLDEIEAEPTGAGDAMSLADNNMMQPAVYKELSTEDDSHTLYVSGLPINKNKVNGFLKSASRLLGSRSKQTEE